MTDDVNALRPRMMSGVFSQPGIRNGRTGGVVHRFARSNQRRRTPLVLIAKPVTTPRASSSSELSMRLLLRERPFHAPRLFGGASQQEPTQVPPAVAAVKLAAGRK